MLLHSPMGRPIGEKSDIRFHHGTDNWKTLCTLTIPEGQRRHVHHAPQTQSHAFPRGHLIVDWTTRMMPHAISCIIRRHG